jgi:hypothetical protein
MFSLSGMILGYVNCGKEAEGFGPISTNTTGLKVGLNICKDGILAQTGHVHEAEGMIIICLMNQISMCRMPYMVVAECMVIWTWGDCIEK